MRGGAREGAGLKPRSEEGARVHIGARVLPSTERKLKEMAQAQGISLGAMIDRLVQ